MGVPIVQGNDLVVLDSRLYLKTIAGIERGRRRPAPACHLAARPGHVRSGEPLRRSRPPFLRAQGLARRRQRPRLRPREQPRARRPSCPPSSNITPAKSRCCRRRMSSSCATSMCARKLPTTATATSSATPGNAAPAHEWVAEAHARPRLEPLLAGDRGGAERIRRAQTAHADVAVRAGLPTGPRPLPVTLRAFALGRTAISPCALAWTGTASSLASSPSQTTDRVKDVWILRTVPAATMPVHAQAEEAPETPAPDQPRGRIAFLDGPLRRARRGDRAHPAHRADAGVAADGDTPRRRQRRPLWAAMAAITGHSRRLLHQAGPRRDHPARSAVLFSARPRNTAARSCLTCYRAGRTPRISANTFRPRSGRCSIIFTSRSRFMPTKTRPSASA